MEEINLNLIKDSLKSYHLIKKIYDIHNDKREDDTEPIEYNLITVNLKILEFIQDVNFVYLGNIEIFDKIKEYKKVGNLLNLQVFLDPNQTEDKVIFHTEDRTKSYELKINF